MQHLAKETEGYTGADIGNICREAKSIALDENIKTGKEAQVTMESLEDVIGKTKPSAPDSMIRSYKAFLDKYGQR